MDGVTWAVQYTPQTITNYICVEVFILKGILKSIYLTYELFISLIT